KKVLVTGHTGFKGAWLCSILKMAGAEVTGYALNPPTSPSLYDLLNLDKDIRSFIRDIRDYDALKTCFDSVKPEIVFHLAAQPLVRESYSDPRYTYETNVIGTVNVLECIRFSGQVRSFLNITTDKVYENQEWEWGYRENDVLNGYDPYSNSKSCSELVTSSFRKSFFSKEHTAISTARAGNVIGGGDFAKDRIVPDCVRAAKDKQEIIVRNPYSVRPYQHVLEPLFAYLLIAAKQYEDSSFSGCYNVGPDEADCCQTGKLVDLFCQSWGEGVQWINKFDGGPHEANFLKLDCSRMKNVFTWKPMWNVSEAIGKTVEWSKRWIIGERLMECMHEQIRDYYEAFKDGIKG
ncbi:MAG: CDP-glucose 4,6-dehydratase, partial [Clostridiaceae bacterium]|nr:CDP-glucose 4,6-dehydratase [Clostridiaceae bacterium]